MKILLVEDDRELNRTLLFQLEKKRPVKFSVVFHK